MVAVRSAILTLLVAGTLGCGSVPIRSTASGEDARSAAIPVGTRVNATVESPDRSSAGVQQQDLGRRRGTARMDIPAAYHDQIQWDPAAWAHLPAAPGYAETETPQLTSRQAARRRTPRTRTRRTGSRRNGRRGNREFRVEGLRVSISRFGGGHPMGLPGQAVNLPGQAVGLPGQAVGLPGQAVGLPGQAVGLPGQAVGLPGQALLLPGRATRRVPQGASKRGGRRRAQRHHAK